MTATHRTPWHRRGAARLALAASSGAALALALPHPDQGWLAWVALVPLLLATRGLGPLRAGALGWTTGLAATAGTYWFVLGVPGFRLSYFVAGTAYLALYPAAWSAAVRALPQRTAHLLVGAPALWVAVDLVRAHAGFLAVPWGSLAHTQHADLPLLQLASVTGEAGVAALVVLTNVAIAEALARRSAAPLILPATLVALVHSWGAWRLAAPIAGPALRVAVVQASIATSERDTPQLRAATIDRLEALSRQAVAAGARLVVWPETSVPDLTIDKASPPTVVRFVESLGVPIVLGASEAHKFAVTGKTFGTKVRSYNNAYLVVPGKEFGEPYRKVIRMPFGEYLPFESVFPWPAAARPWAGDTLAGDRRVTFALPDGTRVAPVICWEGLFPGHVRRMLGSDARLLAHLTNARWCGTSGGALQHELASIYRAAENGVPVAIASNTGPSMIVDARGHVLAEVPGLFTRGIAVADVHLGCAPTFYRQHGDVAAWCLLGLAVLTLASRAASGSGALRREDPDVPTPQPKSRA